MKNYKEKLKYINTFIFDFDGVLTNGKVITLPFQGKDDVICNSVLVTNVKDGYAIQYAVKQGYNVCVLTGNRDAYLCGQHRFKDNLGADIIHSNNKTDEFQQYISAKHIQADNVVYMGDDIPDYKVMQLSGLKACPADAAVEIQAIADYISIYKGGEGCVRDIIEQTLRAQNKWLHESAYIW
ncbi:MAG: HAD hydrolase family protein [Bacteroidales bacterium]|nr:HAD hydrolase family protein [Bacteroidales bacterium]